MKVFSLPCLPYDSAENSRDSASAYILNHDLITIQYAMQGLRLVPLHFFSPAVTFFEGKPLG